MRKEGILRQLRSSVLLVFSFPGVLWAATYADLEKIALETNPTLRVVGKAVGISELNEASAQSLRTPNLNLIGGFQKFQDEDGLGHQMSIGPRLSWPLYAGGRIRNGIEVAGQRVEQTKMAERIARIVLRRDLREEFAQAIYAKNLVALAAKIQDRRQKNLEFMKLQYEGGLEFQWAVKSQEAKLMNAQVRVLEAQLSERTVLFDLEQILGRPAVAALKEIDETGFYDRELGYDLAMVDTIVDAHPQTKRLASELVESGYQVKVSQGARLPTLTAQADLMIIDTHDHPVFPFWSAGVRMSFPIFEGRRNLRNVAIARLQEESKELNLADLKRTLRAQIGATYQNFELSRKRVDLAKVNYDTSNDRANVVSQQYRSGLTNFLNWERAMDDWEQSEDGLLKAVRDYQVATARFEQAIGMEIGS